MFTFVLFLGMTASIHNRFWSTSGPKTSVSENGSHPYCNNYNDYVSDKHAQTLSVVSTHFTGNNNIFETSDTYELACTGCDAHGLIAEKTKTYLS